MPPLPCWRLLFGFKRSGDLSANFRPWELKLHLACDHLSQTLTTGTQDIYNLVYLVSTFDLQLQV
jgi:hypothetical protein